jgi:hypothetical protein
VFLCVGRFYYFIKICMGRLLLVVLMIQEFSFWDVFPKTEKEERGGFGISAKRYFPRCCKTHTTNRVWRDEEKEHFAC